MACCSKECCKTFCVKVVPFILSVTIASLLGVSIILFFYGFDHSYFNPHVAPNKWCAKCNGTEPILTDTACPPVHLLDETAIKYRNDTVIVDNDYKFNSEFGALYLAYAALSLFLFTALHDILLFRHADKIYHQSRGSAELSMRWRTRILKYGAIPWALLLIVWSLSLGIGIFGPGFAGKFIGQGRSYPYVGSKCECFCGYTLAPIVAAKLMIYLVLVCIVLGKFIYNVYQVRNIPAFLAHKQRISLVTLYHYRSDNDNSLDPTVFKVPIDKLKESEGTRLVNASA
eukprot:scpid95587/ scgid23640/ 